MDCIFKRLIRIAGAALEAEDRLFLGSVAANQIAYPGEKGGILRINNERYYQFVVARALASSFPFPAAVEVNSHDLVLRHPSDPSRLFAVIEMKRWMCPTGEQEIPAIIRNIREKLIPSPAEHALMLIFSANPQNPPGMTRDNLRWLAERLGIAPTGDDSVWESYSFPTLNTEGQEVEFWVAGYEVARPDTATTEGSA